MVVLEIALWSAISYLLFTYMLSPLYGWNMPIRRKTLYNQSIKLPSIFSNLITFRQHILISNKKKARPFIWTNLNPFHLRMFVWNSGGENFVKVVWLFLYYVPLEKGGFFIWTKLNLICQRMFKICNKFDWKWPSGSGEEENAKSLQQQQQRTTDKLWSEKLNWAFRLGELKQLFKLK